MAKTLTELTADIIKSQCSVRDMTQEEITSALQEIFLTLQDLQEFETKGVQQKESKPAINPKQSILKNKIICLECGGEFKMLSSKHLTSHGLTGREYKAKHGFKQGQPLCAKSLSDTRKKSAKERGLPLKLQKVIDARKKTAAAKKKVTPTGGKAKPTSKKKPVVKVRKKDGEKLS